MIPQPADRERPASEYTCLPHILACAHTESYRLTLARRCQGAGYLVARADVPFFVNDDGTFNVNHIYYRALSDDHYDAALAAFRAAEEALLAGDEVMA